MKSPARYIWSHPRRYSYRLLAFGSFGLGVAGVFLPLLPTTPFLLLGFWAATRGNSRFAIWLVRHPRHGVAIRRWRRERSLPLNAKRLAWGMLALNWAALWYLDMPWIVLGLTAGVFLAVATYLYKLPTSTPIEPERR